MLKREITEKLKEIAKKFPVITITGPRQSGKTTLCKQVFADYRYVTLENLDTRLYAENDPRGFLEEYNDKVIIDEAQNVPVLFSYIQGVVDENKKAGQYILSGSQNFLLLEKISQSLAGRTYIFHLLPFSQTELNVSYQQNLSQSIYKGGYPAIYDRQIAPLDYFPSYIQTYIERDVRSILQIKNLNLFSTFLKVCAGRIGQLFNASDVGNEIGVDHKTIQSWLSILEASFVLFRLHPWHVNFNKRVVKTPKLYFYDTGLACYLLGIREAEELNVHFSKGALFENYVITEYIKNRGNKGDNAPAYFWRDNTGNEIDLLADLGGHIKLMEIKAGKTIKDDFFKSLTFFEKIQSGYHLSKYIVYGGENYRRQYETQILPWNRIADF
ncbi:ATP-binding protein [Pedobacter sp. SL55]|uniref:ATP-binding protein n=1 Tax=Pedobacter sp. SL55 TaxID=2995161 RepID=UPI0022713446|nr:ATP-binding protein [Pedobacter sp. SL55]WAC41586.1 ATP-binding protein [Pedobacter sp. SL55]